MKADENELLKSFSDHQVTQNYVEKSSECTAPPPLSGPVTNWSESGFAWTSLKSSFLIILLKDFATSDVAATGLYSLSKRGNLFFGTGTKTDGFHRLWTLRGRRNPLKMQLKTWDSCSAQLLSVRLLIETRKGLFLFLTLCLMNNVHQMSLVLLWGQLGLVRPCLNIFIPLSS